MVKWGVISWVLALYRIIWGLYIGLYGVIYCYGGYIGLCGII